MNLIPRKWTVTPRQQFDLEMLLVGGFSPLYGFLSQADYYAVLANMRLKNNFIWPMPINLDVTEEFAAQTSLGEEIYLCDIDNTPLAYMTITDKWQPDKVVEADHVFGTQDQAHPGVEYLFNTTKNWYLGGPVRKISLPKHFDFEKWRHTPQMLKKFFKEQGWQKVIGFQTRNPIHRAHMELTLKAMQQVEGNLLLHPVVGITKADDLDYAVRVRCYQKILSHYPKNKVLLSLLPLAMRMAGPREALWHALIRKNYGCSHFIVGRDHAGPGNNSQNQPFYHPYAAQDLVANYEKEIGIEIITLPEMVYVKERQNYSFINDVKANETVLKISGTELRNKIRNQQMVPEWFTFKDILEELKQDLEPKREKGLTLFFTGLSGSGKSTLARALSEELSRIDNRSVSILDGDIIRQLLGDKLGFSKEDRNLNVNLVSFIAAEITKARGIAICALIAPYDEEREKSRKLISKYGNFIEIYNATPLTICQKRDPKGLYAKVAAGLIKNFTGIDDEYELPKRPDIILDTSNQSIADSVKIIIKFLYNKNYLHTNKPKNYLKDNKYEFSPI